MIKSYTFFWAMSTHAPRGRGEIPKHEGFSNALLNSMSKKIKIDKYFDTHLEQEGFYPSGFSGSGSGFTPSATLLKAVFVAAAQPLQSSSQDLSIGGMGTLPSFLKWGVFFVFFLRPICQRRKESEQFSKIRETKKKEWFFREGKFSGYYEST